MTTRIGQFLHAWRPQLWAAVVGCLLLTPGTIAKAVNTYGNWNPEKAAMGQDLPDMLNPADADTYRAIFAEQAKQNWAQADALISQLDDRRLMGHVLADRYQRRQPSNAELQSWLARYGDLPEARELDQKARRRNASNRDAQIKRSRIAPMMGRGGEAGFMVSGFRIRDGFGNAHLSADTKKLAQRMDTALRRGRLTQAKELLEIAVQKAAMPKVVLVTLQSRLAASFLYQGNADEACRLTQAAYMQDNAQATWVNGLCQYQLRNYTASAASFGRLGHRTGLDAANQAAAAFWAFRSLQKSGRADEAQYWLAHAARSSNSFYGMLAEYTRHDDQSNGAELRSPAKVEARQLRLIASQPAGWRGLALLQIGQTDLAEKELGQVDARGRDDVKMAVLGLAKARRLTWLAAETEENALLSHGLRRKISLPLPSWQPQGGFAVDRALIYALARRESKFDPLAVSRHGACGLMQLMPVTAHLMRGTAAGETQHHQCPEQFFDPVTNVGLGQDYIRRLAAQPLIGDNLLFALVAYNAGPGRLAQYADQEGRDDPLLFIESLPQAETHDYVQHVLMYYWAYQQRLGETQGSLQQLANGRWPILPLKEMPVIQQAQAKRSAS